VRWGLREVRYGHAGENHTAITSEKDDLQSLFRVRHVQVHRLLALRACLRRGAGHHALTIEGTRLRSKASPGADQSFLDSECVSCGACVQACPTATLMEKASSNWACPSTRAHHLRLLRRRLLVQGRDEGRSGRAHGARYKDGKANHGHACVKGRFALAMPRTRSHHHADDPRQHHCPGGGQLGGSHRFCRDRRIPPHPGQYGRKASAASPPRAAPTRKPTWCRNWCVPPSATTMSIPARASAIRPPATASRPRYGESAGTQDFDSDGGRRDPCDRRQPDRCASGVCLAMKRRLRQGAKLIVADPRSHRPGAIAAYRGRASPALRPAPMSPCSTPWRMSS
jgi:formate dehydrogenase major subunit